MSFKWNDWLEVYIETATYTDLKNPTTTNYRNTSFLHIYTSKVQTNMGNQIFNDNIMQLTWHINKHGCNIYAWVQLSKWKVENTMLEHLFLLHIEINIHHNLLLCVVLQGFFKQTSMTCTFLQSFHSTVSTKVQNMLHYLFKTTNLCSHRLYVGVSSSIKLFYNITKTVFLMKLKIWQSKYK